MPAPYLGSEGSIAYAAGWVVADHVSKSDADIVLKLIREDHAIPSCTQQKPCALRRAWTAVSTGSTENHNYDDAELILYSGFHNSSDPEDHATIRLFEHVSHEPLNTVTWHLYRDGNNKRFLHDKPSTAIETTPSVMKTAAVIAQPAMGALGQALAGHASTLLSGK